MKCLGLFIATVFASVALGTCLYDNIIIAEKIENIKTVGNGICPDKQSQCPDGTTCCQRSSGRWGCCPMTNAVCCNDHQHCCPEDTTCDLSAGTCKQGDKVIPFTKKIAAIKTDDNVVCPGGGVQCPSFTTCCILSSGHYGCCPLPNAVCCSDHQQPACCPHGYTCSSAGCTRGDTVIPFFKKIAAIKTVGNVICPDQQSQCPDGTTCCKLSSGQWGCCPMPNAVCCSDHEHCCPEDTTCDLPAGTCKQGDKVIPFFKTIAAIKTDDSVVCPGGEVQCPSGTTCCLLLSGQYGCCPLPNAVCCSDRQHCCPHGYTCSSAGKCTRGDTVIPFFKKIAAIKTVGNVFCPDQQSQCPDGTTCCILPSGQYGCCPMPNAVCCSDHEHCCPEYTTCDLSAGTCTRGDKVIPFFKTIAAIKSVGNVQCLDGRSECPTGNTCCKLPSGEYGCCPLPKAVCCSDGKHCCPNGYTCSGAGTCTRGDKVIPFFKKIAAISSVMCQGSLVECGDGQTCCKSKDGSYACCPLPNAVCCNDDEHCCPSGYTCDTQHGTCNKGDEIIEMFMKKKAQSLNNNIRN